MIQNYIDHTILKQDITPEDIAKVCSEAHNNNFAAVCIPPSWVKQSKLILATLKSDVKVCTVIGFPFGYSTTKTKVEEIIDAIENGADEIDIVQNVSMVKTAVYDYIENEIYECLKAVGKNFKKDGRKVTVKVILESGILTDREIVNCCEIYGKYIGYNDIAKISFIKTSTGYAEYGASVFHVMLIKSCIPETMEIKASGGIRNYKFAKELIDAGATRLGCSAGVKILQEYKTNNSEDVSNEEISKNSNKY